LITAVDRDDLIMLRIAQRENSSPATTSIPLLGPAQDQGFVYFSYQGMVGTFGGGKVWVVRSDEWNGLKKIGQ